VGVWGRLWAFGYEKLGSRMQKVEGPYRVRIVSDAPGDVLEVGAGTGFNFPHYRSASKVVAIEPADPMRSRAERRAREATVPLEVRAGGAYPLPFDDESFDTVVFSLVLCTIPDASRALSEAHRVLRPGGQLRIYEHVRSTDPAIARRQDRIDFPWRAFNMGCHANRDTLTAIRSAGFDTSGLESFDLIEKGIPKVVRPHLIGTAAKV